MDADDPHILIEQQAGVLVLTINEKELNDYELCSAIGRGLVDAINQADTHAVVIDLHNVQFLTSAGVVPFLSAKRCVAQRQGQLALCHLSDFVYEVFATTQLLINPGSKHSVFNWAKTRDEAIRMVQG